MTTRLRFWLASIMLAAVIGLICLSNPSHAGGDKDLKSTVVKIADALKKGDRETARKLAHAAAQNKELIENIPDVMHMFKPRHKGGMGVGTTPLLNKAKDDIQVMVRDLANKVPANIASQADALETTGYWIAAISELSTAKGWGTDSGKRTKKVWNEYSEEMNKLGIAFAKAAAGKEATQIKSAAAKLNENCNRCHTTFKNQ